LTVSTTRTWAVAAAELVRLTTVELTPTGRPAGLPMNVIVVGDVPLGGLKLSQGAPVTVGVIGITVVGELVTVTGCATCPPPTVAFKKTTLGVTPIVFCATKHEAPPISTAVMVRNRDE